MKGSTPYEVEQYLAGVEYPTTKEHLEEAAVANGAPDEVIATIQRLPAEMIDSPEDLASLFGDVTGDEDEANINFDEYLEGSVRTDNEESDFHIERFE